MIKHLRLLRRTGGQGCGTGLGLGGCRDRSLGRDLGDHLCAGSTRGYCVEGTGSDRVGENEHHDVRGHGQTQSARMQTGVFWPTGARVSKRSCNGYQSSCLDLQNIVTAEALVMHLVVSIISITLVLVLDKRETG